MYRISLLRGQTFRLLLTELLASSVLAWTWISKYELTKKGHVAMAALRMRYDGPGETRRRISEAQNIRRKYTTAWRAVLPLSNITKLSEAFEVLHEHGFGKSEPEKEFILFAASGALFYQTAQRRQKKWHRNFKFGYLAIIGASPRAWF
jgi:hypothetical protein